MALNMKDNEKQLGKENFTRVREELINQKVTRRGFMKELTAGAAIAPVGAAAYFGYKLESIKDKPVRAAIIGTGDEGGVLVNEHNPAYLRFIARCDIRPYNQTRIIEGDERSRAARKGFKAIPEYGANAANEIKLYEDYKELLQNKDIEAVVIALPLHIHYEVAMAAMEAGKHVLCEKLMAYNITQCKEMIRKAEEKKVVLSIGHQRHYSMLYAYVQEVIEAGILGDLHHIRALWHRNNSWPLLDKNSKPIAGRYRESWKPNIQDVDKQKLETRVKEYGYESLEQLVCWRLFNKTGGGLMAELGSHQLDACSIFLQAHSRRRWGEKAPKVMPLSVMGVGGKNFYKDDREADDHVYVTYEFPGPNYYSNLEEVLDLKNAAPTIKDKNDEVVVTYSSINTSGFEPYGECVMGSRSTLVVENEQSAMLYSEPDPNTKSTAAKSTAVTVTQEKGKAVLDTAASGPGASLAGAATDATGKVNSGPVSRGYREEMEHFAFCIRMREQGMEAEQPKPRCDGVVAMGDAIIALTANLAMKKRQRIEFKRNWFDPNSDEVPEKLG